MKKPKFRQVLRIINHYVVFFLLVAFVVTCCMMLFIRTMSRTMNLTFTSENIGDAAKITFMNVILLTVLFTSIDFFFHINILGFQTISAKKCILHFHIIYSRL